MTARLTLICHAPTAATRAARFPRDDDAVDAAPPPEAGRAAVTLCAPERRARETAAALGGRAEVDHALRDQDVGRWTGCRLADVAAAEPGALAAWMSDPFAAPHGGESVAALLARVEGWMAERAAAGGRVRAVTHPAVVRAAVAASVGAGAAGFRRIEAPPLAEVRFSHDGRRWTLAALVPPLASARGGSFGPPF